MQTLVTGPPGSSQPSRRRFFAPQDHCARRHCFTPYYYDGEDDNLGAAVPWFQSSRPTPPADLHDRRTVEHRGPRPRRRLRLVVRRSPTSGHNCSPPNGAQSVPRSIRGACLSTLVSSSVYGNQRRYPPTRTDLPGRPRPYVSQTRRRTSRAVRGETGAAHDVAALLPVFGPAPATLCLPSLVLVLRCAALPVMARHTDSRSSFLRHRAAIFWQRMPTRARDRRDPSPGERSRAQVIASRELAGSAVESTPTQRTPSTHSGTARDRRARVLLVC